MRPLPTPIAIQPLAGLTDGFVPPHDPVYGEIQRLLPDLQGGQVQVLLLSGRAGSGKTRLASGLAQSLRQHGWIPLALAATPFQPLSTGRLLAAFATALARHDGADAAQVVSNPLVDLSERLRVVAAVMRRQWPGVLVLDGLESCLDPETALFLEPAMGAFWADLLGHGSGLSRVVITSRLLPVVADPPTPSVAYRQEGLRADKERRTVSLSDRQLAAVRGLDGAAWAAVMAMTTWHYPVPVAGYCAVTQQTPDQQDALLQWLERKGLAQSHARPGVEPLWSLHPRLRGLFDTEKPRAHADRPHARAGEYLLDMATRGQQEALGLGWLDLSLEAVGHFLQCAADRRHDRFARVLQAATPVNDFLSRQGFFWEQERLNRGLLAICDHPRPLYLTAMALLRRDGQEEARRLLERVLTFGEALFPRENALALFDLAALMRHEQPEEAREKLLKALAINQRVEDRSGQAVCHAHLGFLGLQQADMEVAQSHLESALALCRALNDPTGIANLLPWTGDLLWRVGNLVAARSHFQEALQLLPPHDNPEVEAQLHHRLAIMDLGEEQFDQALAGFLRSLEIRRAMANQKGEAVTFFQLGRLAKAKGNAWDSLRFLGLCQRIGEELGDPDAAHMLTLFHELAVTALGLDQTAAHALLDEVWADYGRDRGQSLIAQAFKNG